MPFAVRPATSFVDVATILGPKNPTSSVCTIASETDAVTGGFPRVLLRRPVRCRST